MNETIKKYRHVKSFWGIVIIFVVGMVAGGVIYFVAQNNILQDEVGSVSFFRYKALKTTDTGKVVIPTSAKVTK